jgi:hypothetical protein
MCSLIKTEAERAAWAAGRRDALEEAAIRIEALGGKFEFLVSPGVAAREIRALKDK